MMTILIAMYNFKGGVGKTTAIHNLSYILAEEFGKKVLMVDTDPQCSLTGIVHYDLYTGPPEELQAHYDAREAAYAKGEYTSLYDLYRTFDKAGRRAGGSAIDLSAERANRVNINRLKVRGCKNLFLMPGDLRLNKIEEPTMLGLSSVGLYDGVPGYLTNIFRVLGNLHKFDVIFFDLSPSFGGFNQCLLMGTDYFVIPFSPDFFSFQAVQTLTKELPNIANQRLKRFRAESDIWDGPVDPLSVINTTPKFLGAFSQKFKTRKSKKLHIEKLEQTYGVWLQKFYKQADVLCEELTKAGMLSDNFRFKKPIGIRDFVQAGLDAQASGRPLSDLNFLHRHIEKVDDEGNEKTRVFSANENDIKSKVHNSYRKMLAIMLGNLSREHAAALFVNQPELKVRVDLFRYAYEDMDAENFVPIVPQTPKRDEDKDYKPEMVDRLLVHYSQDENWPKIVALFPAITLKTADYWPSLAANLEMFQANRTAKHALIPLYLPNQHWALIYVLKSRVKSGKRICFYFDPAAAPGDRHNLKTNCPKEYDIVPLEPRVKDDLDNSGAWVVNAAYTLVTMNELSDDVDILQEREEHTKILRAPVRVMRQFVIPKRKTNSMQDVENRPLSALIFSRKATTNADVNVNYEYEDNDVQAILAARLRQIQDMLPNKKFQTPIRLLGAVDDIFGEQLIKYITADQRLSGSGARTVLIPCNLGNFHWVGILIEFDAHNRILRAQYTDSMAEGANRSMHTFEMQLQKLYPGLRLEYKNLFRQHDSTSCGVYAIENLLLLLQKQPVPANNPSAMVLRTQHLNTLKTYNVEFFNMFNPRQKSNRPTIAMWAEQLQYLHQGPRFSKKEFAKELQTIQEIKLVLKKFTDKSFANEIQKIFKLTQKDGDDHNACLNVMRVRLRSLASKKYHELDEIDQLRFDRLLHLLFKPEMDITQFLQMKSPAFRVAFEQLQAVIAMEANPKEIGEVIGNIEEHIKADELLAIQLQEMLWKDTAPDTRKSHGAKRKAVAATH